MNRKSTFAAYLTNEAQAHRRKALVVTVRGPLAEDVAWMYARQLGRKGWPVTIICAERLHTCDLTRPIIVFVFYAGNDPYRAKAMTSQADMSVLTDQSTSAYVEFCNERSASFLKPRVVA